MNISIHRGALFVATVVAAVCVLSLGSPRVGSLAASGAAAPDSLLENQWHLKDRAAETAGVNARAAWPSSIGAGIVIGIVDDGIQWAHPDLSPNYLASASWDFNYNDNDPQPFATSPHGTSVAGVAAARGDNSIGVSGVAPQASLAALRLTALVPSDAQEAAAFGFLPNTIDVLNNSWNPTGNGATLSGPGPLAAAAMQTAISSGRSGKGRVFVWTSGDGRLNGDDCNFDGYANSRYAIAVGALTDEGNQAPYSEGCSALMVVAPSGGGTRGVTTTDLMGAAGDDAGDYTSDFSDSSTSAAAPSVSGAVALMLARNPNVTWRDVQHILRRTSVRVSPTNLGWTSGTFPHNEKYGFGQLDASAAATMAAGWTAVPAEVVLAPAIRVVSQTIPDVNSTGIGDTITISAAESNFVIEHVEVVFDATHEWRGDLQLRLTSPSGVVSRIAPIRPSDSGDDFNDWRFGSVRHWGESPAGVWTLNVADRRFQDVGTWNSWALRIYGYRVTASGPGAFNKTSPADASLGQLTSPTLSWGVSSGAASYEYCYDTSDNNACDASWVSVGSATSVGLSGLAAGTSYYWQVRAVNAGGTTYAQASAPAFWSFTTLAAPGSFTHSSPANGATGASPTTTLNWGASSGASSYEYCYDTSHNGACNASWVSVGSATSVGLSGLSFGTQYSWHVRAKNASGTTYAEGAAAAFWSFSTLAAPGVFVRIGPGDGGGATHPTLSWSASAGAASYEYCVDTTNDNACTTWTSTGNETRIALDGLANGTVYYWHVRAINAAGTTYSSGSASAFWRFTKKARPRPLVDLDGDGNSDVFSYDPATGDWARRISVPSGGFTTNSGNWAPGWTVTPATFNDDEQTDFFLFNEATGEWNKVLGNGAGFLVQASGGWTEASTGSVGGVALGAANTPENAVTPVSERYLLDLDGDGLSDLFVYDVVGGGWLHGISTPLGFTFTEGAWAPAWELYPAKLNGDQLDDFFMINRSTGLWFWALSDANNLFTYPVTGTWSGTSAVLTGDFNGDGLTDVLRHELSTGAYRVETTDASGFVETQGTWAAGWTLTVTDLDGDGAEDVFLYRPETGAWLESVSNGAGSFASAGTGTWAVGWNLYPTDGNEDGRADFVLYNPTSGGWLQARSVSSGTYAYSSGAWPSGLVIVTRPPMRW